MIRYIILSLVFITGLLQVKGQSIAHNKSVYHKTGEAGTTVSPELVLVNTGMDTIETFVNRIVQNLPANWTTCYCFNVCNPPSLDTLRFKLAPAEKVTIGIGFNTDTIPGTGYVRVTVEQVGGNQKDTINFSASTLISGIKKISSSENLVFYPNPFSNQIFFHNEMGDYFSLLLFTPNNKIIFQTDWISDSLHILNTNDLVPGVYFLRASYKSGRIENKKLIKHN